MFPRMDVFFFPQVFLGKRMIVYGHSGTYAHFHGFVRRTSSPSRYDSV